MDADRRLLDIARFAEDSDVRVFLHHWGWWQIHVRRIRADGFLIPKIAGGGEVFRCPKRGDALEKLRVLAAQGVVVPQSAMDDLGEDE